MKFLTIVLFALIAAGAYFLYLWGPLEIDNFDVKKYCADAVNKTWEYHKPEVTRQTFRGLLHRMGTRPVNEDGETVQVPIIDPSSDDLIVQIDNSVDPAVLSIDVTYSRTVNLPGLKGKTHTFWFHDTCSQTLQSVNWKTN